MRNHNVTIPELSMIAGTRAMIGAGVALLVADRLMPEQRRAIGWTLTFVGGLMTIPLALELLLGSNHRQDELNGPPVEHRRLKASPRV